MGAYRSTVKKCARLEEEALQHIYRHGTCIHLLGYRVWEAPSLPGSLFGIVTDSCWCRSLHALFIRNPGSYHPFEQLDIRESNVGTWLQEQWKFYGRRWSDTPRFANTYDFFCAGRLVLFVSAFSLYNDNHTSLSTTPNRKISKLAFLPFTLEPVCYALCSVFLLKPVPLSLLGPSQVAPLS